MTDGNNRNPSGGPVSIWPTVWKFGLIIAAFRIAYNLLLYVTGLAGTTGTGIVAVAGAIALLVVALKRFRTSNSGYVTFGQAFAIGFVTSVIATVLRAIVDAIYLATIGRDFLVAQRDATINQMAANPGMDPQTTQAITGFLNSMFTPGGILVSAIIAGIIGWIILSLIVAAVMKRPPPITD